MQHAHQVIASYQRRLLSALVAQNAWDEASALAGLGRCAIAAGQPAQAKDLLEQAYEIFQRIGAADASSVLAELHALSIPGPAQ